MKTVQEKIDESFSQQGAKRMLSRYLPTSAIAHKEAKAKTERRGTAGCQYVNIKWEGDVGKCSYHEMNDGE